MNTLELSVKTSQTMVLTLMDISQLLNYDNVNAPPPLPLENRILDLEISTPAH